MTSIPQPRQISKNLKRAGSNALLAILIIPLLAFPSELFNNTLEENYDEIRGWFGLGPKNEEAMRAGSQYTLLAILLLASGVLYAALSPDFGFNRATVLLGIGLSVAVFITGLGFGLPILLVMRRRYGEWGRLKVLPGTMLVAAVTVGISRLLNLQPGYLYGLLAAFVFRATLDDASEGRYAWGTSVFVLLVSLAAWVARTPISAAAAKPHASPIFIFLEVVVGGVFLIGLESLLVDLLPMRFLDGKSEMRWSRILWGALFAFGVFALLEILLTPGSGYVGHTSNLALLIGLVLYVVFGVFSFSFWAYFRYREHPDEGEPEPEPSGTDWEIQG